MLGSSCPSTSTVFFSTYTGRQGCMLSRMRSAVSITSSVLLALIAAGMQGLQTPDPHPTHTCIDGSTGQSILMTLESAQAMQLTAIMMWPAQAQCTHKRINVELGVWGTLVAHLHVTKIAGGWRRGKQQEADDHKRTHLDNLGRRASALSSKASHLRL